ncbi:MAG: DUF1080 domain-containing protein [Verrucomicrobia bacterium]|jgi:hypothetical protein|nr:DUF1080 domain-containing protein [Verrucomicrobiota bacterium]
MMLSPAPLEVGMIGGVMFSRMYVWALTLLVCGLFSARGIAQEPAQFEDLADYPLMGDWTGRWVKPRGHHESKRPTLSAQVLPMKKGSCLVVFASQAYRRAVPYAEITVPSDGKTVAIDQQGWTVTFRSGEPAKGQAMLNGKLTDFELTKAPWAPPTLGAKPPAGAVVLMDGSSLDAWQHDRGRAATWILKNGGMETVGQAWNKGQNRKNGLGGNLHCKRKFGSLRYHMEFRYPVEEGKDGQARGNSGLFFPPLPELQVLNAYTKTGYWNESGSMYKYLPAKVNAAGPPLVWQTYDVTIQFTGKGAALVTALLNGHPIHTQVEIPTKETQVGLWLQDHNNRLQWRNIWVEEL